MNECVCARKRERGSERERIMERQAQSNKNGVKQEEKETNEEKGLNTKCTTVSDGFPNKENSHDFTLARKTPRVNRVWVEQGERWKICSVLGSRGAGLRT